jgi:hypothetical protein
MAGERTCQTVATGVGEDQPARHASVREPAEIQQPLQQRGAQRAGQVRGALGPVQAPSGEGAALAAQLGHVDPEPAERRLALRGHLVVAAGGRPQRPGAQQRVGQRHPDHAGEMVVAGAGEAQHLRPL